MSMTPSDIAREADVLAHRICRVAGIPLSDTEMVRSISSLASEHLNAIILSAAAKMVRESGLEGLPDELLAKRTEIANRAGPYMSTGTDGYCDGLSYSARILKERLSALRALTEHKGET